MNLRDTAEEARFRSTLRAWLNQNPPASTDGRGWTRRLADAGYAGLTWPKEYGGAGATASYQAIFLEETARSGAPPNLSVIGLGMAGPTIIAHGTTQQKARYLPKILSADEIWCQAFSEPGAGSDLAAVRTRAERHGERFVVNGQKVWSSLAHVADWCILLAVSDPHGARYRNLTYLLMDMRTLGVEVRPLRQITGEVEFNEIFFDDVEVPVENVLGDIGDGWQVAMTTLLHERGTLGVALSASLDVNMRELIALGRARETSEVQRDALAREWIEVQALRYLNYSALSSLARTGVPGPEASVAKLRWSEANQRVTALARELLGNDGLIADDYWHYAQLRSRGNTIEMGTSEILRNIVAERVLGLPRSR